MDDTTFDASHSIRSARGLADAGLIDAAAVARLAPVLERFSVAITPAVLGVASADADGGVARQFVPTEAELTILPAERADPIGDATHSPLPGIVHRYPDRVLLMPIHVCPVYCRFCFRREQVGAGSLTEGELAAALDYIAGRQEIWEVILSGGDPLLLSARRIALICAALDRIAHARVIRIHTRVPVVDPQRVTDALVAAIRRRTAAYIVIHTNHPDELTASALSAVGKLADAGIPLLGQTVLLKGVNDDADVMTRLLRTLVENRVKPYYLHHGDLARGTGHFRTSIAAGQDLMRSLRGRISGLCQPTYVLDIPGGHGKVPIGPGYLGAGATAACYEISDPSGGKHLYDERLSLAARHPVPGE
jgi:lysine 2,3-aminomutase